MVICVAPLKGLGRADSGQVLALHIKFVYTTLACYLLIFTHTGMLEYWLLHMGVKKKFCGIACEVKEQWRL